ncbi:MAG: tRNA lysidine(34) synthetase TilS, partial [Bacteroidales bacterium]
MVQEFLKYIEKEQLFQPSQRILLAVSGGVDSVVMAHLFYKAGFNIAIAHCHFSLREGDADIDQQFVENLAKQWNLPFYTIRFDTKAYAQEQHISIQMAARDLRFAYFEELVQTQAFDYYATAHHQDDDAETFFINICRGTGIRGMRGILPKNGKLLHPLLFATREQIENYASQEGLSHVEDGSNASDKYLRNKIRHHILPLCKEVHPLFTSHLQESMQRLYQCQEIVKEWYDIHASQLLVKNKDVGICIETSLKDLLALPQYELFLYEYLCRFGFSSAQIAQITAHLSKEQSGKYY